MILRDRVRVAIWPSGEGQQNLNRDYAEATHVLNLRAEVGGVKTVAGRDTMLKPFIEQTSAAATTEYAPELENQPSYRVTLEWRGRRYILDSPAQVATRRGRAHHMKLLFTRLDA